MNPLISPAELAERLDQPDLRVLDASWHIDGRDAYPDFLAARIPNAIFFDLEASSDQDSPLPHMLPSPEDFAAAVGARLAPRLVDVPRHGRPACPGAGRRPAEMDGRGPAD